MPQFADTGLMNVGGGRQEGSEKFTCVGGRGDCAAAGASVPLVLLVMSVAGYRMLGSPSCAFGDIMGGNMSHMQWVMGCAES